MKTYRLYVLLTVFCLSLAAIVSLVAYGDAAVTDTPHPSDLSLTSGSAPSGDPAGSSAATSPPSGITPAAEEAPYRLGQWNGRVALFRGQNPYPDEVYDVYVTSFPAEDQALLKAGIPAADEEALERLLEDYTS